MFRYLLAAIAIVVSSISFASAQVDVNKADQAALDGINGLGPKTSRAILEERKKGGNYKDWADLQRRVKGIGEKSAAKLSQAGLTVNGERKSAMGAKGASEMKKHTSSSMHSIANAIPAKNDAKTAKTEPGNTNKPDPIESKK